MQDSMRKQKGEHGGTEKAEERALVRRYMEIPV